MTVLNRTEAKATSLAEALRSHLGDKPAAAIQSGPLSTERIAALSPEVSLVVNATSVGMWPHVEATPWPEEIPFPAQALAYDLNYSGASGAIPSAFLRVAQTAGAQTLDGLQMLVYQGAVAFEKWTGRPAPIEVMSAALSGR